MGKLCLIEKTENSLDVSPDILNGCFYGSQTVADASRSRQNRRTKRMTEKEKVVFFLDYASIARAAREKRYLLDYHDLLHYIGEDRFLVDAYCYVPVNRRNGRQLDREIEDLWRSGYIVTTKQETMIGRTSLCNFTVEITLDVCKVINLIKPDIVVLATCNPDFLALIQDVRKAGIRVEVAAFEETIIPDMRLKCSGFIDLMVYYESHLAAQTNIQEEDDIGDGVGEQSHRLIRAQEQQTAVQEQEYDLAEEIAEEFADEQTVNESRQSVSDS
jgi:uncharacterized LabA/DUF88 family protein